MQREQLTLQSSLKPFFGGSDATAHFVAGNYFTFDYKEPINTATNPKSMIGTVLENIMFVKNFEEASKAQGMKGPSHDNDVHNQFVDFIVRTALFHREIDNPTTIGSGLSTVRNSFTEAANKALDQQISQVGYSREFLNAPLWRKVNRVDSSFTFEPRSAQNIVDDVMLSNIGYTVNNTYFDFINGVLLMMVSQLTADNVRSSEELLNAQLNLNDVRSQEELFDPRSRPSYNTNTVRKVFQSIIGNCDEYGNLRENDSIGNFCLMSYWNPQSASSAGANVKNILERLNQREYDVMEKFNNAAIDVLAQYCLSLYVRVGSFATIKQAWNASIESGDVNIITQFLNNALKDVNGNEQLKKELANAFADKIYDVIAKEINKAGVKQYKTLESNETARKIYEDVFGNWDRLHPQARNFYRAQLHVFRKARAGSNVSLNESGWVDLMENDEDYKPSQDSFSDLRLNLTHSRPGAIDTLFSYTLPFLPVDNVGELWYTDASGNVRSISHEKLDVNVFKTIYNNVYMNDQCNINGQVLNFPSYSRLSDKDFNLDDILIIRNFIKAQKEPVSNKYESASHASFDDLYVEDMRTHVVYARDENGNLYRNVNGNRVYASDDTLKDENCAGSQLKGDKQCVRFVYECILNGSPDNLSYCLDRMVDENLFNVAQNEFQNINPKMAIQVLKALGVRKNIEQNPVYGKIAVPESFESWKANFIARIADPAKRAAIDKSVNFNRYVKGVITFVKQNPVILNSQITVDQGQSTQEEPTDPYLKALKKRYFVIPPSQSQEGKLLRSEILLNSFRAPAFSVPSVSYPTMPFPNAVPTAYGNPFVAPFGMMSGGSSVEDTINNKIKRHELSSDMLYVLFADVTDCLKNAGVVLSKIDQERLNNGIERVKNIEKRSFELYNMLRTLATIAEFFKSTGCSTNKQIVELSINNLKNRGDTLAYLQNNIEGLQSCISSNSTQQNSVCNELVKTFSDLFNTAANKN